MISGSPIQQGKTLPIIQASDLTARTRAEEFGIDSDGILVALQVTAITGTLQLTVDTLGLDNEYKTALTFPVQSGPTSQLVIRTAVNVLSRIRITSVASGAATYKVWAKAISRGGAAADDAGGGTGVDIRNLTALRDNVAISDGVDQLEINADGSINTQVSGTVTVTATDLDIRDLTFATDSVDVSGSSVSVTGTVDVTATDLDIRPLVASTDSILTAGTEDGTLSGVVRVFVNSIRTQILAAEDRNQAISYADFGTKNQRVTSIVYSAPDFAITAVKTFTYTLVGTRYRRDAITWSLV